MPKYRTRILLGSLICLFSFSIALGQTGRSIGPRDLVGASSVRGIEVSPRDGSIIYTLRKTNFEKNRYESHLWRMAADGSKSMQLTYSAGEEWDPQISPDGHCIAFFSDRPVGTDKPGTRIWGMPLSGGEAKPLTDPERDIYSFKWSGDGSIIYYLTPALLPPATDAWEKAREKSGFDAIDRTDSYPNMEIWQVEKLDGKQQRLFVGDPGIADFDISPDGTLLAYSTNYTGDPNDWLESNIHLFSILDSAELGKLTDTHGIEDTPLFDPGGRKIVFSTIKDHRKPFSQAEIGLVDLASKDVTILTKDLDLGAANPQWYAHDRILVEVLMGMTNHLYLVDVSGRAEPISGGPAYIFRPAVALGNASVVALRQTANGLGEIIRTPGPGHPWQQLTSHSSQIQDLALNPQTKFKWLSRDQRYKLEGLVVLPHDSGTEPLPLIVDIHGGPAGRTDIALEQGGLFQAWASQGFAVFSPNFRGSEGYGAAFQTANYRDLGGGDYHDIMAGVKDLIKRGIAHPDSLVIMGGSYGGYMTNWVITQTNRFKVAVSRYGIFDLRGDFGNSIYAQWELDYAGKPYWDDPTAYRRMSPSTFIKKARTPTLILHGADDENTFTSNSRELARALKTLDVPNRFFLYPREGHGMYEPSHRLDVFQRQLAWVNEHLNRRSPVAGEDWLSKGLKVQVLDVKRKVQYDNRSDEKFIRVKILLDGSALDQGMTLPLNVIRLQPGNRTLSGLPSSNFLLNEGALKISLNPGSDAQEIELVFPEIDVTLDILDIQGLGQYYLNP